MVIELKDYLNQSEAAKALKICRQTIHRYMKKGKLTYVLVGGYRMIPRSEIERLLKAS